MAEETSSGEPAPPSEAALNPSLRPTIYRSAELFAGGNEIWIEHGEEMYRLRITSQGKLLLTK